MARTAIADAQFCSSCTARRPFCALPQELRPFFRPLKTTFVYERGDGVFDEDGAATNVFVLCRGSLKLVAGSMDGRALLLRTVQPGEILGLSEAILHEPKYASSAVATARAIVAEIPSDRFVRFASSHAQAAHRVTVELSTQYRDAQLEAKFLAFGETAAHRLSKLFVQWTNERGEPLRNGLEIALRMTHTELAQTVGVSRETVTRALADLARRGAIERRTNAVIVLDAEALAKIADY